MRPLVIDASALIDTSGNPPLARHLVASYDLCAPTLIRWEIGNVVHGKAPARFGEPEKRRRLVHILLSPVRVVDQGTRLEAIADLVDRHGLTFYDAAYLQLALDEDAGLLSEDKPLLKVASKALGPGRAWDLARAEAAWENGSF